MSTSTVFVSSCIYATQEQRVWVCNIFIPEKLLSHVFLFCVYQKKGDNNVPPLSNTHDIFRYKIGLNPFYIW
jgi:hypothetical protein